MPLRGLRAAGPAGLTAAVVGAAALSLAGVPAPPQAAGAEVALEPLLALRSVRTVTPGALIFRRAELLNVPRGSTVRVSCVARCHLRARFRVRTTAAAVPIPAFSGAVLPAGARVAIEVAQGIGSAPLTRRLVHVVAPVRGSLAFPRRQIVCRRAFVLGRSVPAPCPAGTEFPALGWGIAAGGGAIWLSDPTRGRIEQHDATTGATRRVIRLVDPVLRGFASGRMVVSSESRILGIDPASGRLQEILDASRCSFDLANPRDPLGVNLELVAVGTRVYLSCPQGLEVIDARSGAVQATVVHGCPLAPRRLQLSGTHLLIGCSERSAAGGEEGGVSVIDLRNEGPSAPEVLATRGSWLAAGDGRALFATADGAFSLVDLGGGGPIRVPPSPRLRRLVEGADGRAAITRGRIWISEGSPGAVHVSSASGRPIARIAAGFGSAPAFLIRRGFAWVINVGAGTVSRVDMRRYVGSVSAGSG